MTFDEVLDQVRELLQQRGRVTYRALQRRFELDEEYLEDLKGELIKAEGIAAEEDGEVLVWIGEEGKGEMAQGRTGETEQTAEVASSQFSGANPQPLTSNPQSPAGERRQLTVGFIDLVGSTTLSQQLDPEDYHARVVAYQTACQQVIARYEGHIAQYLSDGVLVYFGYPQAHEDDAQRAVRAGLEIIAALATVVPSPQTCPELSRRRGEGIARPRRRAHGLSTVRRNYVAGSVLGFSQAGHAEQPVIPAKAGIQVFTQV